MTALSIIGLIIGIILLVSSVTVNDKKFIYWSVFVIVLNVISIVLNVVSIVQN